MQRILTWEFVMCFLKYFGGHLQSACYQTEKQKVSWCIAVLCKVFFTAQYRRILYHRNRKYFCIKSISYYANPDDQSNIFSIRSSKLLFLIVSILIIAFYAVVFLVHFKNLFKNHQIRLDGFESHEIHTIKLT